MTHSRNIQALFHGHTASTETRQVPQNMKETRSRINNAEMLSGGSVGVTHSGTQWLENVRTGSDDDDDDDDDGDDDEMIMMKVRENFGQPACLFWGRSPMQEFAEYFSFL